MCVSGRFLSILLATGCSLTLRCTPRCRGRNGRGVASIRRVRSVPALQPSSKAGKGAGRCRCSQSARTSTSKVVGICTKYGYVRQGASMLAYMHACTLVGHVAAPRVCAMVPTGVIRRDRRRLLLWRQAWAGESIDLSNHAQSPLTTASLVLMADCHLPLAWAIANHIWLLCMHDRFLAQIQTPADRFGWTGTGTGAGQAVASARFCGS